MCSPEHYGEMFRKCCGVANLKVGLNIKNLFDVYYFESADSIDSVYPAAPFTVLGTVSVQF
ncbi:TonB-dependent receptor [Nostoc sp. UHCC 0926]|uniref:TonB-dependent receptor n=1 Tax=unclassified Nostoc TaxID=2593658 RepID=UPI002360A213|nr:TonB-dependent receptor [Nostoc sp. UHCC 0926]WDD31091.1 TonB-dependent receptor [Nostoc sp. UHCC 0926]